MSLLLLFSSGGGSPGDLFAQPKGVAASTAALTRVANLVAAPSARATVAAPLAIAPQTRLLAAAATASSLSTTFLVNTPPITIAAAAAANATTTSAVEKQRIANNSAGGVPAHVVETLDGAVAGTTTRTSFGGTLAVNTGATVVANAHAGGSAKALSLSVTFANHNAIITPDVPITSLTSGVFMVEMWANIGGPNVERHLFHLYRQGVEGTAAAGFAPSLSVYQVNTTTVSLAMQAGLLGTSPVMTLTTGWHHICAYIVQMSPFNKAYLAVDGAIVGSIVLNGSSTNWPVTATVGDPWLLAIGGAGATPFPGVSDIRITNGKLSPYNLWGSFTPDVRQYPVGLLPAITQVATAQDTFAPASAVQNITLGPFTQLATASLANDVHLTANQLLDPFLTTPDTAHATAAHTVSAVLNAGTAVAIVSVTNGSTFGNFTQVATALRAPRAAVATQTIPNKFYNYTSLQTYQATPDTTARALRTYGNNYAGQTRLVQRFAAPDLAADYPGTLPVNFYGTPTTVPVGKFKNVSLGIGPGQTSMPAYQVVTQNFLQQRLHELHFWFFLSSSNNGFSIYGQSSVPGLGGGGGSTPQLLFNLITYSGVPGKLLVNSIGTAINGWGDQDHDLNVGGGTWGGAKPATPAFYDSTAWFSRRVPTHAWTLNNFNYGQWNHVVLEQIQGKPFNAQLWLNGQRDLTFALEDSWFTPYVLDTNYTTAATVPTGLEQVTIDFWSTGSGYAAIDELRVMDVPSYNPASLGWSAATGSAADRGKYYPDSKTFHHAYLDTIFVPDRPEYYTSIGQLLPAFTQVVSVTNSTPLGAMATGAAASAASTSALTLAKPLTASASAQATATSYLTGQLRAVATSIATASSALSLTSRMAASPAVASSTTAALTASPTILVAAVASSSATATATAVALRSMAATPTASASSTSAINTSNHWLVDATAAASASASVALTHGVPLATAAAATTAATATVANASPLAAAGQGVATATATAVRTQPLSAAAASSAAASASLFLAKALADAAVARASVAASISLAKVIAGVAQAQASASANMDSRFIFDMRRGIVVPPEDRHTVFKIETRALIPLPP